MLVASRGAPFWKLQAVCAVKVRVNVMCLELMATLSDGVCEPLGLGQAWGEGSEGRKRWRSWLGQAWGEGSEERKRWRS
jgi:hypothetical protein